MRRTVSITFTVLATVLAISRPCARAEQNGRPWESNTPPRPAPEDTESPGVRPQQRGIPEGWKPKSADPGAGASRTDTPGSSATTTTMAH